VQPLSLLRVYSKDASHEAPRLVYLVHGAKLSSRDIDLRQGSAPGFTHDPVATLYFGAVVTDYLFLHLSSEVGEALRDLTLPGILQTYETAVRDAVGCANELGCAGLLVVFGGGLFPLFEVRDERYGDQARAQAPTAELALAHDAARHEGTGQCGY
jgi:hypothetical protein